MKNNYLITGGAGFIGVNVAAYYLARGKRVTLLDCFVRDGNIHNVRWLQQCYGDLLSIEKSDIRQFNNQLRELVDDAEVVFHLAGQVAVTTSVTQPRHDFEVNALGTLNVLEAVRTSSSKPIVVYSSTNKVYGEMADVEIAETAGRYAYAKLFDGVKESYPLDFHSPYGCSKGAGDQYVIDYARIYGLKTIVFRQSCIYGPHQFGMEDQGWLAWFGIRALQNLPVTVYGDGKQVRDVLYVDDLILAYDAAIRCINRTAGQAYNIGGGPKNTLSLLELISLLERYLGNRVEYSFAAWRPGDQRVYVSDISKANSHFSWEPRVDVETGVAKLVAWLKESKHLFNGAEKAGMHQHVSVQAQVG
jgi:CDP-paratose 2-epimerase